MSKAFTDEDDALLAELGVEVETGTATRHTPREQRVIAGFEEIQRFALEHGRAPRHGEDGDILERLHAARLDRIRELDEARALVEPMDHQGLLAGHSPRRAAAEDDLDDDALLAELGVDAEAPSITKLRHVRSAAEKRIAEEIANREACKDFGRFKPLFERVQSDLDAGLRSTRPPETSREIDAGRYYIVSGQKAYVAEKGDRFKHDRGEWDARLRVIFDNGTESNLLSRSLYRAMRKDPTSRTISDPVAGPLFTDATVDGDEASGTVYVLRSKSDLPVVEENRDLLHKIGVTGGSVERRVANAKLDPTFLMADVEIVSTYELYNINRAKLENLLHRVFERARMDVEVKDRFGCPVTPREWFLVPLSAIDEVMDRIRDGSIKGMTYDPGTATVRIA